MHDVTYVTVSANQEALCLFQRRVYGFLARFLTTGMRFLLNQKVPGHLSLSDVSVFLLSLLPHLSPHPSVSPPSPIPLSLTSCAHLCHLPHLSPLCHLCHLSHNSFSLSHPSPLSLSLRSARLWIMPLWFL